MRKLVVYISMLAPIVQGAIVASGCAAARPTARNPPPPTPTGSDATAITTQEARDIAREAYVFGLPMVENYKIFADTFGPNAKRPGPPNKFWHADKLFTPDDHDVVSPNNDTLYSRAILDLRAEPVVIQTPAMGDRYYSIQLVDIVTNNLPYIGTRTTGRDAGAYVIAGPDWSGNLPPKAEGLPIIRSPSRFVVALGRTAVTGPSDVAAAHALQTQIRVEPLSTFAEQQPPPPAAVVTWPPYYDPKTDDSLEFFGYVDFMMRWHKFEPQEAPMLARFERITLKAGSVMNFDELTAEQRKAMREGLQEARQKVQEPFGPLKNGWQMPDPRMGNYGDDYLLRAKTAWAYLYANSPAEAIYPIGLTDGNAQRLDGQKHYTVRFQNMPPARFFWSLTVYDASSHMLVENPAKKYSIGGSSTSLEKASDGSLTVYLQHDPPAGGVPASNWLPTPAAPFYAILRIYGPTDDAAHGGYTPPAIEQTNGATGINR